MNRRLDLLAARVSTVTTAVFWGVLLIAAEPPPAEPEVETPWNVTSPRRTFANSCFELFSSGTNGISETSARQWLEPVDGFPLELVPTGNQYGCGVKFKGRARLRCPWPEDAVLRISTARTYAYSLRFWGRTEGVVLRYYPAHDGRSLWAAYRTCRPTSGQLMIGGAAHVVADADMSLLTTDGQRSSRTPGGTYAFRHQNGSLVMTKGDVRMLTAPLAEPPTEVILEAPHHVTIRDLAMFRGDPAPDEPVRQRSIVIRGEQPARLPWRDLCPQGARIRRFTDGRIELSATNTTAPAFASVPLIRPGLYEIVLEIENPSSGTGISLVDKDGTLLRAIGFFRDTGTGLPVYQYDQVDSAATTTKVAGDSLPVAYAGRRQWLRLVPASGVLKVFASGDGKHWGQVLAPAPMSGSVSRIALYTKPGDTLRSICLRRLQVRQLDGLAGAASIALLEAVERRIPREALMQADNLSVWQTVAWEHLPSGTDPRTWRRACAVVTLAGSPDRQLGNALLERLIEDCIASAGAVADKLRLLDDAALIYNAQDTTDTATFARFYRQIGEELLRKGNTRGFEAVQRGLMMTPLCSPHLFSALDAELCRFALFSSISSGDWTAVSDACRRLRFLATDARLAAPREPTHAELLNLVAWAQSLASRHLPNMQTERGSRRQAAWRHPVVVHLSKEAYNTQAELESALREESYRAACNILTSTTSTQDWGLVGDRQDSRLHQSLPTAIFAAMRDHPELSRMMRQSFRSVDRLRVQQAMAQANVTAIEAVTARYSGTPAASEAHGWLGDRFLSDGHFSLAIGHYAKALRTASAEDRRHLLACVRLAEAMMGRKEGQPISEPVRIGQRNCPPDEFEPVVAEMLQKHAGANSIVTTSGHRQASLPPPASFLATPWGKIDGDSGSRPEAVPAASQAVDWPARQMSITIHSEKMIVSNRFQIVAFNLQTGTVLWRYSLATEQGYAHAWPLVRMRTTVRDGRVYARLLPKTNQPALMCLDANTGKPLWRSHAANIIVSDPLWIDGSLFAFTVSNRAELIEQLMLTGFDPHSGAVLSERPLIALQNEWKTQHVCQATSAAGRIVAAIAGGLISCDTMGHVQWVRRDPWLPTTLDQRCGRQHQTPPLVAGECVYVTQPGATAVECVDRETGRLHWECALPGLRGVIGLADNRLLVETDYGIDALSATDGTLLWHHAVEDLLYTTSRSTPSRLLYVRSETIDSQRSYPVLVWLDVTDGRKMAEFPLRSLESIRPAIGPLIPHAGRMFCFTGTGKQPLVPQRDILQLIPKTPIAASDHLAVAWSCSVDISLVEGASKHLPGWTILSGTHDTRTGLRPNINGSKEAFVTKADAVPTRMARWIDVPPAGKTRLELEFGHDPQSRSKLQVRAEGMPLQQWITRSTDNGATWQSWEIDLSRFAGRRIWITIVQEQTGNSPGYLYWKRLDVSHE